MGGQVLAQPDGLRPLPVRVAGHDRGAVGPGAIDQREAERAHGVRRPIGGLHDPEPHRRLHLVVSAAARVHRRAEVAQQPLDGRVDILVGRVRLDLDLAERSNDLLGQGPVDQALASKHPHVHRACAQVVRQQPAIDIERRRERQDDRVEPALEPARPQWIAHASTLCTSACAVAAAQVLVPSDHTWMKPAAAPCW